MAAAAGERAGERERDRDRPVDVDPHHRRRLGVLSHRPHRLALLRRADEPREHDQHRNRDQQHGELVPRVRDVADADRLGARDEGRDRVEADAVDRERDVLDDERHADRRDQHRQPRPRPQPAVGDELDRRVHDREQRHHRDERQQHPADDHGNRIVGVEAEHGDDHGAGDEAGEGEDVAVREVDQLQDPVDERVAERDEPVDGAVREPDQADVDELGRILEEVDEQPDPDEREEAEADQRGDARLPQPVESRRQRRGGHEGENLNETRGRANALPRVATCC